MEYLELDVWTTDYLNMECLREIGHGTCRLFRSCTSVDARAHTSLYLSQLFHHLLQDFPGAPLIRAVCARGSSVMFSRSVKLGASVST